MKNKLAVLVLFIAMLSGCASSTTGPGAGGAEGVVKGQVDHVSNQAQTVFKEMNIQMTGSSTKNNGNERQITGKLGDSDITVTVDNVSGSASNVKVDASKNMFNGDKNLAQQILTRIVQES